MTYRDRRAPAASFVRPRRMSPAKLILNMLVLLALITGTVIALKYFTKDGPTTSPGTRGAQDTSAPAGFNSEQFSIDDSSSLWAVVNKLRPLQPKSYVPDNLVVPDVALRPNITADEKQLRADAADALAVLMDAGLQDGIKLRLESGYRSYNFQNNLYNSYVKQQGQKAADRESARPGHSEHQTGLGVDLGGTTDPGCNIAACFAGTPEGKWLAANAYLYGFVIRYPDGKESTTGYIYEPWHLRYVGADLAREMHSEGIATLEEFFTLPAAPNY